MPPEVSHFAAPLAVEQPHADYSFRRFGRNALAIAGVSLALLGAKAAEAPSTASGLVLANPITQKLDLETALTTSDDPLAPAPPVYQPPIEGIATFSWNDDGLGHNTLFKNAATEGLQAARLGLLLNKSGKPSREMRSELASAHANNIGVVLSLPENMDPQAAAKLASHLPGVSQFVYDNEVNSPVFSSLRPDEYVHKLAQMTSAIHTVRPDAEVRGFALASGYDPVGFLLAAKQVADSEYGGLENIMDGLDVHLYRTLPKDMQMLQEYMQIYTGPIYVGEYGWIVNDPDHPGAVSLSEQADNEIALYNYAALYPQIKELDIFRLVSQRMDPFDTANISPSGTFRPAWFMLQSTLNDK